MVLECVTKPNQLSKEQSINLLWIPGYNGGNGNEVADKLTNRWGKTPIIGTAPFCGIVSRTLLKEMKKKYVIKIEEEIV